MDTDWHLNNSLFTPPTIKLFWVSNERFGQNKTFLLRCYGIDFAPIKRYHPFCFLWLYIRRQRLSLYDLFQLSVLYLSVCLIFFLCACLCWLSICLSFLFFLSVCLFPFCLSFFSFCPSVYFFLVFFFPLVSRCFTPLNRAWPWRMSDLVYLYFCFIKSQSKIIKTPCHKVNSWS